MSAWEIKDLGDVVTFQRGYDLPSYARSEGNIPVVSSSGITDYHSESKEKGPGIITGRYGTLGAIHYLEGDYWPHNTTLFVKDFKGNYPRYIYYLLKVTDLAGTNSAGAVPGINRNALYTIKITLPPLPLQRRIADILGRYDALIDNYQRQITALENLAQEIYREWFVRGRCPYAEPGEDGGLPVGWEKKTLSDIASDTRRMVRIENVAPDTPYVGLEHLSVKSILIKDSGTIEDVDSDKLLFRKDDILFGKIRAYLHKVCLSHFDGVCSSDTIVIRPKIDHALGFVLFTVFDDHFIEFADKVSNGTKMPRSEWKVLKTYEVIVPTPDALQAFDKIAISAFNKIANLQTQLTTLRQTRDALLPRLLSGQLAIGDALAV